METINRRTTLALGITAAATPLIAWATSATAQTYGPDEGKEIGLDGVQPTVKRLCSEEALPVVIQVSEKSRSGLMIRIIDAARMGGAKDVSVASQRS